MRASPLQLYAVVPAEAGAGLRGAAPRGVRAVDAGPVMALAGAARGSHDKERAALRHDRVVRAALGACGAVVPFRHGVVLPDLPSLRAVLVVNQAALEDALRRVRGKVEMGLRALLRGPEAAAQLAALRAGLALLLCDDWQERIEETAQGSLLRGSYLIGRGDEEPFFAAVAALRAALPEVPLLGAGPFAPYSFCRLQLRGLAHGPGAERAA